MEGRRLEHNLVEGDRGKCHMEGMGTDPPIECASKNWLMEAEVVAGLVAMG